MKHKLQQLILLIAVFLVLILTGCSAGDDETEPLMGIANPASVYCQGLGFEERRENEFGQYGVCLFQDGSECDTWDFLAGRCGTEHSYCVKQGFTLEPMVDENIATCIFEDGSTCSEFLYFQGECKPGDPYP